MDVQSFGSVHVMSTWKVPQPTQLSLSTSQHKPECPNAAISWYTEPLSSVQLQVKLMVTSFEGETPGGVAPPS